MGYYHVHKVGQGQPLLFFPAAGFTVIEGLNLAEELSNQFECHLIDLPGFGKSEGISGKVTAEKIANWVKNYIEEQKWEKVTLMGHSMGGGVALCFAYMYPNYVQNLILLDQGHLRIPRFPTDDFGPLGYMMPILSLLEKIFGDKLANKMSTLFSSDVASTEEQLQKRLTFFYEKFPVEKSPYITNAFQEGITYTPKGIRFMFGYFRLHLPNLLNHLSVPSILLYASYKGFDEKRAKLTQKGVNKIRNPHVTLCKLDSHHYFHWDGDDCIIEIRRYLYGERTYDEKVY